MLDMRDILFKAKRLDNREWVEGYVGWKGKDTEFEECNIMQSTLNTNASPFVYPFYFTDIPVDSSTVCEYTGRNDKTGRKIFDRDILEYEYSDGSKLRYMVCWMGSG